MARRSTAQTLASLEALVRDAHDAYNFLRLVQDRSPAMDQAQELMADIALAAAMLRWPDELRNRADRWRREHTAVTGG